MSMSSITVLSTTFFGSLGAMSAILSTYSRKKAKSVVGGIRSEQKGIEERIALLNNALHDSIENLEAMVSLDEYHVVSKGLEDSQGHLSNEQRKREALDAELQKIQDDIALREKQYSTLKQGNQNVAEEKDELLARAEAIQAEIKRLENQLNESRVQLNALESEVKMTEEQRLIVQEVSATLDRISKQVKELSDSNEQSTKRYQSLQNQYDELEKEYRRLIEAELNATA